MNEAAIYGGWLAFVYAAMQFVCAPMLGNLSDRFGRRPVLLFAIAALGIDYLVMGFAPTLGWLFVGPRDRRHRRRLVHAGLRLRRRHQPAREARAELRPDQRRVRHRLHPRARRSAACSAGWDPRAPFFAAAGLSLANFVYGLFVLPESLPPERRRPFDWKRANPLGTLLQMRRHPVVLRRPGGAVPVDGRAPGDAVDLGVLHQVPLRLVGGDDRRLARGRRGRDGDQPGDPDARDWCRGSASGGRRCSGIAIASIGYLGLRDRHAGPG